MIMEKNLHILLVEDLPTDAELAEREVRKVLPGGVFLRVETQEAFLDALEAFQPDLILCDYRLPRFDGMTALSLALERVPETPFIILTGSMNEETAVACMKAGAWDYVIKEHVRRLGSAVVAAMDKQRVRQESRMAEKALRDSEARFRAFFDNSQAGMLIWDNGDPVRYVAINETLAKLNGRPASEHIGKTIAEVFDDRESVVDLERRTRQLIDSRVPMSFESRGVSQDGRLIQYAADFFPLIDAEGDLVGIGSIVKDITHLKAAEAQLIEKSQFIESIVNFTPDILYIYDIVDRKNFYSNKGIETVLGYSVEEIQALGEKVLPSLMHPDDFQTYIETTVPKYGETPDNVPITHQYRFRHKGGQWRWLEFIEFIYSRQAEGSPQRIFGVAHDITERKKAAEEREKLHAQLIQAQKMESVGRLAGGVAHDFNNKLSTILGFTELTMAELDKTDDLYGNLQQVFEAGKQSSEIVRQLLAFARKQTISPKVLSLNDTVAGMVKMLGRLIGEDIDLAWKPDPDLWAVKMDPSQVDQILANLCVNARDAIAGVGKITIETQNTVFDEAYCRDHAGFIPGEFVMLAVSDNGCGMDRETLANVFEPFFTTKEIGKGTGLGLSTVYGIAKQNQGFVNVYSEPDKGTTFKIYLPRHAETEPSAVVDAKTEIAQGRGETILLVEDDPTVLRLGERMLEGLGYMVIAAQSPDEAIGMFQEYRGEIHLLITDVVMPGMSGRDLSTQIRAIRPDIKTLFMSGYTANVIAHHGVLDEGVHFIEKPFSREDLAVKVLEALDEGKGKHCA